MTKELAETSPSLVARPVVMIDQSSLPIEAGPIIIDDNIPRPLYDGYLDYDEFRHSAVSLPFEAGSYSIYIGQYAQRYAIMYMIANMGLGILPPEDARGGESRWRALDPEDYYIEAKKFLELSQEIQAYARGITRYPKVLDVLADIAERARKIERHDTEQIALADLPGAFTTEREPASRIRKGEALSFEDFRSAVNVLNTSPGKVCDVFDNLIELMGDEEAKQKIGELSYMGNPTSRLWIRQSCYLKTQALVEFVDRIDQLPKELRKVFNGLGIKIIRNVIYDEDRAALPVDDDVYHEPTDEEFLREE